MLGLRPEVRAALQELIARDILESLASDPRNPFREEARSFLQRSVSSPD